VAAQMGMPFFQGFKTRTHKRGHYPKAKSGVWGDIPPLELKDVPPVAPIILIDDVASSGTTIAESAALLQEFGPVFPLVWIAGETSLDT
jgi:adenine/guanine phosphoribosyltransferase-like PRPP-binding protein